MESLIKNIRFYVLVFSIFLSCCVFLWVKTSIDGSQLQIIRLEQIYAFTSIIFLYFALLAGPFCYTFRWFPYKRKYLKARRALGVSAFYFAFLHSGIALFGQLDGFAGLAFLRGSFLFAVILGFDALFILALLAITSFDSAVKKLTFPKWKLLHGFVYLAGMLILIHFLMLGTHYSNLTGIISQISFFLLAFLLILEAPRLNVWINRFIPLPHMSFITTFFICFLGIMYFSVLSPFLSKSENTLSFDIHAAHRQLAQQALQSQQNPFPGLQGDRTKRYTVSMSTDPSNPQPNQDVTIRFKVYDASSGNRITFFRILYAKTMHLITVNSDLTYFSHMHPTQEGQDFVITTQFPTDNLYHLYIQFQPFGGIEQQIAFTLPVGQVQSELTVSKTQPDTNKTKIFADYAVSVNIHGGLNAAAMSVGQQTIGITIKDAKTGKPITNLKPYLGSFGHLTMINEKTYDFLHVHPFRLTAPPPDANGGPTVDFLPIGIYGPFKSGIYRAFAEFNPDNKLFIADFTVKINS